MYIKSLQIRAIRSIAHLSWQLDEGQLAGWHVFLGANGSGKSTVLRSISLALVGPENALALRQDWEDWLTYSQKEGRIQLGLTRDKALDAVSSPTHGDAQNLNAELWFIRRDQGAVLFGGLLPATVNSKGNPSGWFSAAYGPFRRFSGGNSESERLFATNPKLAAHLSIFGEDVALSEALNWLRELNYKQLEGSHEGAILKPLREFINQEGFLPYGAKLEAISSNGVFFVDANGYKLPVESLSDGYRSVLSMTFELIRQMQRSYSLEQIFAPDDPHVIIAPGVVLIDEVDVHLHPSWQRRIGTWFRQHFPRIQFIVTTHSPLVCQAAEVGTVWRLPRPGSDEQCQQIVGAELDRLVYGNILEAYSTTAFGEQTSRPDSSQQSLQRLAELNWKELDEGLSAEEAREQERLRATFPLRANTLPSVA